MRLRLPSPAVLLLPLLKTPTGDVMRLPSPFSEMLLSAQWRACMAVAGRSSLQLGRDVEVRPSGGNKGLGVFARTDLAAGALLGRYAGNYYADDEEYQQATGAGATSGDYVIKMASGRLIDAEDPSTSSWTRYINHSVRKANAAAYDLSGSLDILFLEATKPIAAGEEILFDYGAGYWDSRFLPLDPRRLVVDYL